MSFPPRAYVPELMFTVEVSATVLAAVVSNVPPETLIPEEASVPPVPICRVPLEIVVSPV